MKPARSFSDKIIRIYLFGTSALLAFYIYAFHTGILLTENTVIEQRINIVAPFHFKRFESDQQGIIKIDPLLTLYATHALLPDSIKTKIAPNWTGSAHLLLADEREYQVVATQITDNDLQKVVYAVEDSNPIEWDDTKIAIIELSLALIGLLLFLATMLYMIKAAKKIASPFLHVADKLATDSVSNFDHIQPLGEKTKELAQILTALNAYRARLAVQLQREQSFTRYVSHELRTPMMIIRGAISNLRHQTDENHIKPIDKIAKATDQMQELTQTFLLLARDGDLETPKTQIDNAFLEQRYTDLETTIKDSGIDFQWQLREPFELCSHPQLVNAVISNLLKNAFACSVGGKVTLLASEQGIDIIDNGIGLEAKPRGYEGFGIGLVLVNDICDKYGWRFSLTNNETHGCTATIDFTNSTDVIE